MAEGSIVVPAEWEKHKAVWTCWPSHAPLWQGRLLDEARKEIARMVKALSASEAVKVLAMGYEAVKSAQSMLGGGVEIIPAQFGDIWLRDTGPIFARQGGQPVALRFRTNGWGGKYIYEFDDQVGDAVAARSGVETKHFDFVMEGGALEHDGEGTILTTRQCLLNPNRNPGMDQATLESALKKAFGAHKILWLDEGMLNDHTDGHIDNVARFVAPGRVVCQSPFGNDDPNEAFFEKTANMLASFTDAAGRRIQVERIPSPGRVERRPDSPRIDDPEEQDEIMPASHMNFIIGNKAIVVPTYNTRSADDAVAGLARLFPEHTVIGASSKAVLTGGGSFHCITQQEPLI